MRKHRSPSYFCHAPAPRTRLIQKRPTKEEYQERRRRTDTACLGIAEPEPEEEPQTKEIKLRRVMVKEGHWD